MGMEAKISTHYNEHSPLWVISAWHTSRLEVVGQWQYEQSEPLMSSALPDLVAIVPPSQAAGKPAYIQYANCLLFKWSDWFLACWNEHVWNFHIKGYIKLFEKQSVSFNLKM